MPVTKKYSNKWYAFLLNLHPSIILELSKYVYEPQSRSRFAKEKGVYQPCNLFFQKVQLLYVLLLP